MQLVFCDMCIAPKKILNRSNHYDVNLPLYIYVPCGKCEECCSRERNDWFVRLYYEWRYNAVQSFFYTLTFNEANLPHSMGVPCFSRKLVQLFLKRLRSYLDSLGVKLRYMVTSEYGTLRGRPHHHANFFLDKFVNPYQFYKMVERAWTYGFVQAGDNVGQITSLNGLQYVVKYVTKDFSYTDKYDLTLCKVLYSRYTNLLNYINSRNDNIYNDLFVHLDFSSCTFSIRSINGIDSLDEEKKEFVRKFLSKIRQQFQKVRPFHLQSTKLGCSILNEDYQKLKNEVLPVLTSHGVVQYALPRYIKRKLWYDVIESEQQNENGTYKKNRFVLSDVGKKHVLERSEDMVKSKLNQYMNVLNNASLISDFVYNQVNQMLESPSRPLFFPNKRSLTYFLQHFDLDLRIMSIYNVVFRGRICPDRDLRLTEDNIIESYVDFISACLYHTSKYDYGKIYESKYLSRVLESRLFDYHPFFVPYEQSCRIFDTIIAATQTEIYNAKKERDLLVRQTREFFNKLST